MTSVKLVKKIVDCIRAVCIGNDALRHPPLNFEVTVKSLSGDGNDYRALHGYRGALIRRKVGKEIEREFHRAIGMS
jgi:hypothetical protein